METSAITSATTEIITLNIFSANCVFAIAIAYLDCSLNNSLFHIRIS